MRHSKSYNGHDVILLQKENGMSNCARCGIASAGGFCGSCGQAVVKPGPANLYRQKPQLPQLPIPSGSDENLDMTFRVAIRRGYANMFNYRGKATIAEYWWFYLYMLIVDVALRGASYALATGDVTTLVVGFVTVILTVVNLLSFVSLLVRRFHDTGRSGWKTLIGIIPIFGFIYVIVVTTRKSQPAKYN
jgi:uncharacterized membrane protein YhaH (DUF805 family)